MGSWSVLKAVFQPPSPPKVLLDSYRYLLLIEPSLAGVGGCSMPGWLRAGMVPAGRVALTAGYLGKYAAECISAWRAPQSFWAMGLGGNHK